MINDCMSTALVPGVVDDNTSRNLMSMDNATFEKALNPARRYETGQYESRRHPEGDRVVKATKYGQPGANFVLDTSVGCSFQLRFL